MLVSYECVAYCEVITSYVQYKNAAAVFTVVLQDHAPKSNIHICGE